MLSEEQFQRYLLAGSMYTTGILSGEEARRLTGNARRVFEENMAGLGFAIMPDDDEEIAAELEA